LALPFVRQNLQPFLSTPNHDDLATLQQMMESGTVTTVIDRTYLLSETPAAVDYVGQGHAGGKVVVTT
jgi:NADPH:quinone reductase-like Zn-dependent oxidoreductase